MKKAFSFAGLAIVLLLAACGPQATPTAVQPPPTTLPPTQDTTPPTTAPQSPTVAPTEPGPTPTAPGSCNNSASFVADVTIPDYAHLDPKEAFTKTWRVKNSGTCAWTAQYKAVYARGDALGAPLSIALADTPPGGELDISADMTSPNADGKYQIFYQLTDAAGDPMPIDAGDSLWALITVGKVVVYPPATPTGGATSQPASSGTTTPSSLPVASCVYQGNDDFITQTFNLINAARAANGLPALAINDKLSTAAQAHSADMACNNFLDHSGWDGSTPASRIAAAGYLASITRENIYGQPPQYGGNPQAAVDWWMGDQIHRDAILNAQVKDIGIGYAAYSRSTLGGYFTVDFGAP